MADAAELTSIVILTRDRLQYNRRCLETLAATSGALEWIVIDNGSSDGTREYLERWRGEAPGSRTVVHNKAAVGAARARNQGWRLARGQWVAFLDNDVYLDADPGWLETLLAVPRADDGVVAVSPLLLFPGDPELVQCAGGGVTGEGRFGLLGRGGPAAGHERVVRPQAWAPTAALVVRRGALAAIGGLDEAFDPVPICEDLDLCCRLRGAGGGIAFAGSSRLRHSEGTTFGHLGYDKRGYWQRHARVIRERWLPVLTSGPVHSDEEIAWHPVRKEYEDFAEQRVRLAGVAETAGHDASFFASEPTLAATPPPPRVGVVGCGQAALRGALPGLAEPGSELAGRAAPFLDFGGCGEAIVAGVADSDRERAEAAARLAAAPSWALDGHELLARTPLEGVVVATPPASHAELTVAALERDVSVLVEKPGAASEAELDAVLALLSGGGRPFCMVNLPWEFHPGVHTLAAAIAAGRLGEVRSASALFEHAGPAAWAPGASWYFDPLGGGVTRDLGLHAVAVLERLLGGPLGRLSPRRDDDSRATAAATIGAAAVAVEVGWDAARPRFLVEVEGTRGHERLELIPYRGSNDAPAIAGGPYRHFVDCLRSGTRPLTDLTARAPALRAVLGWATALEREAA